VIAFFWSPDSQKLAYFMYDVVSADVLNAPSQPDAQADGAEVESAEDEEQAPVDALPDAPIGLVRMNVFDLEESNSYPVVFSFYPTADFARMLLNFDQYNRSATIWSPDSNNIVLSGTPTVDGNPVILVVASSGTLEPRFLLDGLLAFWSWN
jgi:Tol biopolymer transport system component